MLLADFGNVVDTVVAVQADTVVGIVVVAAAIDIVVMVVDASVVDLMKTYLVRPEKILDAAAVIWKVFALVAPVGRNLALRRRYANWQHYSCFAYWS